MEGEWSCYRGDHFNGGKIVRLQRWPVCLKENGHVTEVVSLMEGEWSSYRGGLLMEGEWSCYRGGH